MNKRIRYVTLPDGRLESMQVMSSDYGHEYKSYVANNSYQIIDVNNQTVTATGKATSLHKAKIAAKQALVMLGCAFEAEKRKARTSEDT